MRCVLQTSLTLPEEMEIVTDDAEHKIGQKYLSCARISIRAKNGYNIINVTANDVELSADENCSYSINIDNEDMTVHVNQKEQISPSAESGNCSFETEVSQPSVTGNDGDGTVTDNYEVTAVNGSCSVKETMTAKIKIDNAASGEIPEGWYASLDGFEEMARRDFENKHPGDERSFYAEAEQIDENTVECSIYELMGDRSKLDVYTLDVRNGTGTNQAGEEISLPQTGITSWNTAAAIGGAFVLVSAGLWLLRRAACSKEDEE